MRVPAVVSCKNSAAIHVSSYCYYRRVNPTLVQPNMRYWRLQPDPRLRPWILCYFLVEPNDATALDPNDHTEQLLLPDGHAEIVFNLGNGYDRWQMGSSGMRELMRSSYLIGGRSESVFTRNRGPVRLAGVKLDPRLLRRLIRASLSGFSDGILSLRDLNDTALLDLEDAVACAGSAASVQRLFDDFFLRVLANVPLTDPLIDRLVRDIRTRRGSLSIMNWARDHGIDARRLERCFGDAVGMTPKRYARVIRFKHSYQQFLEHPRANSLYLDGYYDQSHFNKEFKHFLGVAPKVRLGGKMPPVTSVCDHLLQGELTSELSPRNPRSISRRHTAQSLAE
jgi:AraC-like DNA-binding protein